MTARFLLAVTLLLPPLCLAAESTCFGSVAKGRLEGGVALPSGGANFSSYSSTAELAGRTYVHSRVREIVLAAYLSLQTASPQKVFVYGETGWKTGGRIRPHRTHQNGLSVDFMVPVRNAKGRSVPLPSSPLNKFGYDIEFDAAGRFEDLSIDFEAIAEHLYQLDVAARARGSGLALIIFDEAYLPRLYATPRGEHVRGLKFMRGKPWIRHDEHYHVDFAIKCAPL